ncbi:MAG: PIN domain-containing protein [Dehalococcoidia bacterium]
MADGLLDTTFFIDLRGDQAARILWRRIVSEQTTWHYSPITVTELWISPFSTPAEESGFYAMLSILEETPLTTAGAQQAGLFLRELGRPRDEVLLRDALIGCSANVAGLSVYTRNYRDMSRFAISVRRY